MLGDGEAEPGAAIATVGFGVRLNESVENALANRKGPNLVEVICDGSV